MELTNIINGIESGTLSAGDVLTFLEGIAITTLSGKNMVSSGRALQGVFGDVGKVSKAGKGQIAGSEFRNNVTNNSPVKLKHRATSGVELTSTPGKKTTTILGRYDADTKDIINELKLPKSTDFSGNPGGFNLLNTPDDLFAELGPDGFWNMYNKPFLDAAISRGDEILMATPINNSTLYTEANKLTGYGREYFYLISKGYQYVGGKMILK